MLACCGSALCLKLLLDLPCFPCFPANSWRAGCRSFRISGGPKMNEFQEGQKRIDTEERCTVGGCQDSAFLMCGGFVVKDCF